LVARTSGRLGRLLLHGLAKDLVTSTGRHDQQNRSSLVGCLDR
jgi:hypothetical protein